MEYDREQVSFSKLEHEQSSCDDVMRFSATFRG